MVTLLSTIMTGSWVVGNRRWRGLQRQQNSVAKNEHHFWESLVTLEMIIKSLIKESLRQAWTQLAKLALHTVQTWSSRCKNAWQSQMLQCFVCLSLPNHWPIILCSGTLSDQDLSRAHLPHQDPTQVLFSFQQMMIFHSGCNFWCFVRILKVQQPPVGGKMIKKYLSTQHLEKTQLKSPRKSVKVGPVIKSQQRPRYLDHSLDLLDHHQMQVTTWTAAAPAKWTF